MTRRPQGFVLRMVIAGGMLAVCARFGQAGTHQLASPAELARVADQSKPGDTLVLADGVYRDHTLIFRGRGEEGKPITLRAATPGKVVFTGKSSLEIKGSWLVVDGLVFDRAVVAPITLRDAQHCRLTNCAVIKCNPEDATRIHWIRIAGAGSHHNRIDHCYAEGKTKDGVVLVIDGDEGKMSTDNRIDHNYFKDVVRAVRNGMETIRVGTSEFGQVDARAVVEYNRFENASGDAEIISSKSCANVYRYNTFVNCDGAVVMRHGHRSIVEGNFFFGDGGARTAGVRVHGSGHKVINNYFSGLGQFSISLPAGQSKFHATGHEPTIGCVVAHNTVVDPHGPAIVIGADKGDDGRDSAPKDTIFANNLVSGSRGVLVEELFAGPARWQANIVWARGEGRAGAGKRGVLGVDPRLEQGADRLWRPGEGSSALGAAVAPPLPVKEDMDGQTRAGRADIGADERSSAPVLRRPLTPADVGPDWMRRDPARG